MGIFISIIVIAALVFGMNFYAFQGLKPLINSISTPLIKQSVLILYWGIPYLMLGLAIYGLMGLRTKNTLGTWGSFGFNGLITLFVTFLTLNLIFFGSDIWRGLQGLYNWLLADNTIQENHIPGRRKFIAQVALLVAAVPLSSFIYGVTRGKYNYKVHRHILKFPNLPEAFHGFTITQISDIHSGSFDNPEAVQEGIQLINEQKSDLVVFTGDLVNNLATEFEPWINHFKAIDAPLGKYSVLGNHDYGDYVAWPSAQAKQKNHEDVKEMNRKAGFRLLLDEHVKIKKGNDEIVLAGVENWGHGFIQKGDIHKALENTEHHQFKVLLSHDPTHFEHVVKNHPNKVHLTLSGHTHGMQMGIEIPGFKWSPVQYRYARWAGLYEENERKLHINRGFGFLGFSGRVGIWPEITVIELQRG